MEVKTETNTGLLPANTDDMKQSDNNTDDEGGDKTSQLGCCSQRWILAFMGVWLGIMVFMLNSSMNLAIVCMVKSNSGTSTYTHAINYETNLNKSNRNGTLYIEEEEKISNLSTEYSMTKYNRTSMSFRSEDACDTTSS